MLQEVTVAWERQRLLLFIIYLDDQGNDADDQNTELKQIGIGHHVHHPPPLEWRRKQEEVQPPPEGGAPPTVTGSAWVDYSILCRIWQERAALSAPCGGTSPEGGGKGRWGSRAWSWLPLWGSWQRS